MTVRRCSFVIGIVCMLPGCSSLTSNVESPTGPVGDGVVYYMPSRPIKIDVSVDDKGKQTATVDQSVPTIPDLRYRFTLNYDQNWVGKNHIVIGISASGLLNSADAATESGLLAIAKNLGALAGTVSALGAAAAPSPPKNVDALKCENGKTYSALIFPGMPGQQSPISLCAFTISVKLWGGSHPVGSNSNTMRLQHSSTSQSGVFYKHDLPYLVTIQRKSEPPTIALAFSPNESEIGFVPITRTLFSDNAAKLTFENGILKGVDQSADGELVALSEVPAAFIGAYFEAVGKTFSAFSSNTTAQANLIGAQQSLALATQKQKVCAIAIASNNLKGKIGDALTQAIANIKAACA